MNSALQTLFALASGTGEISGRCDAGDWRRLAACARSEELLGLMYPTTLGRDLPEEIRSEFRDHYRVTAQSNLVQLHEFTEVARVMCSRDLQMILLPGASLLGLYPDIGCRPMDDMDILVKPSEYGPATAALRDVGMAPQPRYPEMFSNECLTIDLHTDLSNCSRIRSRQYAGGVDPAAAWNDAVEGQVEGIRVNRMCLEDETLFSAVHALRHGFSRCTWFVDLLQLLRCDLSWSRLEAKAIRYRLQRPLAYALAFLAQLGECHLPVAAASFLDRHRFRFLESRILRRAFAERGRRNWGDLLWSFNVSGRFRKCLFLGETFFPSPQVMLQVFPFLPRALFPAAYPLRLLQILGRGAGHGFSLLPGWRRPASE